MTGFANWLESTGIHLFFYDNYATILPAVQSIHIIAVAIVFTSIFLIDLKIFGWAGRNMSLIQTVRRYGPWVWGGLILLVITGIMMILTEPTREFLDPGRSSADNEYWNLAFWIKMGLIAVGVLVAVAFQRHLRRNQEHWEQSILTKSRTKMLAGLTLLGWIVIIVMGRMIAFPAVFSGGGA